MITEAPMEAIMAQRSRMHVHLNWTRERLDEMDAALASLESKAIRAQAESKAEPNQLIADLKKRRDEFEATAKRRAEAGEAAWQRTKTQLEAQWDGFEKRMQENIAGELAAAVRIFNVRANGAKLKALPFIVVARMPPETACCRAIHLDVLRGMPVGAELTQAAREDQCEAEIELLSAAHEVNRLVDEAWRHNVTFEVKLQPEGLAQAHRVAQRIQNVEAFRPRD